MINNRCPGKGPLSSRIAIIGQAPGAEERRLGEPNVGPSGKLLKSIMREADIDWQRCYLTNIIKEHPPGNKFELVLHLLPEYLPLLIDEISALKDLRVIVVCGRWPLKILCELDSIEKWRGSIIESKYFPGIKIIPTCNPADVLQFEYRMSRVMKVDFDKIREEAKFPEFRPPEYNFIHPLTTDEIIGYMDLWEGKTIPAIDTETYQPLRMSCMSISPDATTALSIPFEHAGKPQWRPEEEVAIIRRLDRFLKNTQFIMQNAMYDLFVFRWLGYRVPAENLWMDTMLAHACLYLEYPHGLDFQTSIYTRQNYYKDEGKVWHPTFDYRQLLIYNCTDSVVTKEISEEEREELNEFGMWDFYNEQYNSLIPPLLDAAIRGIPVNRYAQKKLTDIYAITEELLKREVWEIAGENFNVRSSKQMQHFLYDILGFEKVMKKGFKKNPDGPGKIRAMHVAADESTLKTLMQKYQDPRLQKFIYLRKVQKVISTYINPRLDSDDRIRCSFNLMGTSSGRISEGKSPTGSGMTLHNLPRQGNKVVVREWELELPAVKRIFGAEQGQILLIPDYKSAESFIVAMLAEEEVMLNLLLANADIHKYVASHFIYNKPEEDITKDERYLSKRTGHASNYDMSWKKFMEILAVDDIFLPAAEAKRMIESYHEGFPNIRAVFHKKIQSQLIATRELRNCFGRRRFFFGRLDDELFRKGYAQIPQSTVSDMLNRALKKVATKLPILGELHDAMWVLSPIKEMEENIRWIWDQMKIPIRYGKYEVCIPADMKYGFDLDRMKEYKDGVSGVGGVSGVDWDWIEQERLRHEKEMGWI